MKRVSSAFDARILYRVRALFYPLFAALLTVSAGACGNLYTGSATTLKTNELDQESGWVRVDGVPEMLQKHELDCGPTALAMVLAFHGGATQAEVLAALSDEERAQVTQLRDLAKKRGFDSFIMEGKPEDLVYELQHGRPVIVGVAKPTIKSAVAHYEVVVGLHRESQRIATIDPAVGLRQNTFSGFLTEWQGAGRVLLVVIPKNKKPETQPVAARR